MKSSLQFLVRLYGDPVGHLVIQGRATSFSFDREYLESRERLVLGLQFEDDIASRWTGQDSLPPWFGNLLPEGRFRDLLISRLALGEAEKVEQEAQLMLELGRNLPGAVQLEAETPAHEELHGADRVTLEFGSDLPDVLRFSIAGVGLKLSMMRENDRFLIPNRDSGGDWIVKLPDLEFANVPRNEYAMMRLASRCGINVPQVALPHRDELEKIDDAAWGVETEAYAVKRFDRGPGGARIHIEDMAQVRGYPPRLRYRGSFETVAALYFRGHMYPSLDEFVRRLTFSVAIANADAHLKNWSLIYSDRRVPTISPTYDLVSVAPYPAERLTRSLALSFSGSKDPGAVNLESLGRLERKLRVPTGRLVSVARETMGAVLEGWDEESAVLEDLPHMRQAISDQIAQARRWFEV